MKESGMKLKIAVMFMISLMCACASSYQDRLEALNAPDAPPADKPSGNSLISRDDMPLSGACIINADCGSSQFCDLGLCVSECSPESPCDGGLFCSARGKCVESADYVDVDPEIRVTPPVAWHLDRRVVQLDTGKTHALFNIVVDHGGALQYRVHVEPEDASAATIVSAPEGVVASGGSKSLTVTVDRSVLSEGDHRITTNVISDGGQEIVFVELSNGWRGRYAGFMDYRDPGLGRVPLIIDLEVDKAGEVLGRVRTQGSVLFPVERTITGQLDGGNMTMFLSFSDLIEVGSNHDPFQRPIGREIYLFGDVGEQRAIRGQFEEIISGLAPQPINVSGEFYLTRTTTEIDTVVAHPDVVQPEFPIINTCYSMCPGFNALCDTELEFRSNMVACAEALRTDAFKLGVTFSSTNSGGEPVVNMGLVEECRKDVAGSGTHACIDIANLSCLEEDERHYVLNSIVQDDEFEQYFEDLKNLQRIYAFMGNDLLVDAYRTTVETVSNSLSVELSRLEAAAAQYENAEQIFFGAENIAALQRASPAVVAANEYELFRVPLQYISGSQSVLMRIVSLTLRRDLGRANRIAMLRTRIQEHARVIYLEAVMLAQAIALAGGNFENELAQIADELRAASSIATVLDAGLNPLGYATDYVPFIYDPADTLHATNFAQLAFMASMMVESAAQNADFAASTVELMQVKTEDVQRAMQEIELSYEWQIRQICGVNSMDLLLECGQNGGELAVAYSKIEEQYGEIEKINQQIADVQQMVKIKTDAANQIIGVKNKTLEFLQTNGAKLEALDILASEVQYASLKSQGMFGSIGGFFSGIMSMAGGIGSMFVPSGLPDPSQAAGGLAGGVGSMISAGLGASQAASSANAALKAGRIAAMQTHIRQLQQMRFQEEGMEINEIQAAAEVKMLLLQIAQFNLDLEMADLRLEQYVIQAKNLLDRVDFLAHERDVLFAQEVESVNNPLSNLSFRLKRDYAVLMATNEFEKALGMIYLAARGLEYELNVELPQIESQLFQANSARQLEHFLTCLEGWSDDYRIAFGSPHQEVTQLSLREDILGFTEPVTDEVTGEVIQPQEIFRRVLLNPQHITQTGAVEFPFVTSVIGENRNFSALVCNDRIKNIRVMLVGDFLGDNEATVMLKQEGNSYLRDCSADPANGEDILNTYNLDARNALVQAGVNDFGLAQPNYDLAGRSVASDRWVLVIPTGAEAPNNADIDFLGIDDVVIEITHEARTLNGNSPTNVFSQCNL